MQIMYSCATKNGFQYTNVDVISANILNRSILSRVEMKGVFLGGT